MTTAERKRESRDRKRARGICLDCPQPATQGVYCVRCQRKKAGTLVWLRATYAFWQARGWRIFDQTHQM
jgi:hypothetical protein